MTREEFGRTFRFELLAFITESFAARQSSPSDFGRMIDAHHVRLKEILDRMYNTLAPKPLPATVKPK